VEEAWSLGLSKQTARVMNGIGLQQGAIFLGAAQFDFLLTAEQSNPSNHCSKPHSEQSLRRHALQYGAEPGTRETAGLGRIWIRQAISFDSPTGISGSCLHRQLNPSIEPPSTAMPSEDRDRSFLTTLIHVCLTLAAVSLRLLYWAQAHEFSLALLRACLDQLPIQFQYLFN
jgi:hypothetical protein